MIKIHTVEENKVEMKIEPHTPHQELILGLEMLIEAIVNETKLSIDDVLEDVKRIYERDKEN